MRQTPIDYILQKIHAARTRARGVLGSLCVLLLLADSGFSVPHSGVYDQLIATTAQRHGFDPALVKGVIGCESQFDPLAQSPRGAQGLMQLMPATQILLGVRDAFDPQDNVEGGVYYLSMLKRTFQDNLSLILAAYNAGPQAVVNAGYTVPPFAETQRYVQCVLEAQNTYRQPGLSALLPGLRGNWSRTQARAPVVVNPLRLSRQVASQGKVVTVQLEAQNTSRQPLQGTVMLYYPAHLVSLAALHNATGETTAHFPASSVGKATPADETTTYQVLRSPWPAWQPGEQRRAMVAVIPRLPQDLMLYLSVVFESSTQAAAPPRWSSVIRIPVGTRPR